MSVLATLVSYGCIQVFVACCVLRWAHGRGAWVTREAVSESTGFREAATRTVERWWMPKEAVWGTTLAVALGLGGMWPASWAVLLLRSDTGPRSGSGPESVIVALFATLLLGPALAGVRLVLRRPGAAGHAHAVGLASVLGASCFLLLGAALSCTFRWPRDPSDWIWPTLEAAVLGASVSLIRAGAEAEAAETTFLAEPNPQT